jgi:hypothetical protein
MEYPVRMRDGIMKMNVKASRTLLYQDHPQRWENLKDVLRSFLLVHKNLAFTPFIIQITFKT